MPHSQPKFHAESLVINEPKIVTFLDALGDEEGHVGGRGVADAVDEDAPAVFLLLAPAVGPPQDYRVRLHATQTRGLDPEHWVGIGVP